VCESGVRGVGLLGGLDVLEGLALLGGVGGRRRHGAQGGHERRLGRLQALRLSNQNILHLLSHAQKPTEISARNATRHESSGRTDLGVFGVPEGQLGGGHLQVDPPLNARDQAADGRTVACGAPRHRSCKNQKNEKRRKNERRQKNEASTGVDGTGDSVEIGLERSAVGHQLILGRRSNRRRQA
jgi:hypothetical protein